MADSSTLKKMHRWNGRFREVPGLQLKKSGKDLSHSRLPIVYGAGRTNHVEATGKNRRCNPRIKRYRRRNRQRARSPRGGHPCERRERSDRCGICRRCDCRRWLFRRMSRKPPMSFGSLSRPGRPSDRSIFWSTSLFSPLMTPDD